MTARTPKSPLHPVSSTALTPQTASPIKVSGGANYATAKFNFLAWANRDRGDDNLGAVAQRVLTFLVLRQNQGSPVTDSVDFIGYTVGAKESSVRAALSQLKKTGDITVVPVTGLPNRIFVNFSQAPTGWLNGAFQRYKDARPKKFGPPLRAAPPNIAGVTKSTPVGAGMLAPSPLGSPTPPLQNPGPISIPSQDYNSISSSICPSGQLQKSTFVEEEKEEGALDRDVGDGVPVRALAPLASRRGAGVEEDEDFDTFVRRWPKPESDHDMLRKTWNKYVRGPKVDPDLVLDAAEVVAARHRANPNVWVPMAGKWLKDRGWRNAVTTPSKGDLGMTGDGRKLFNSTVTATASTDGSCFFPAAQDRGIPDPDDGLDGLSRDCAEDPDFDLVYPRQDGDEDDEQGQSA